MKVQRQISRFALSNEELVGEMNIDFIPLVDLKWIFNPSVEDPLMYYPYEINQSHAKELYKWISLPFNFTFYTYYIECYQA